MGVVAANKKNNKWTWIGLGGAILFCLCSLCVAGFVILRMGQQFGQSMKTDREGAAKAAHAIMDYELPPGYQERVAMDFFAYSMVVFMPGSTSTFSSVGKPIILLAQFRIATNQQQMEEQMRRSLEQQSGRPGLKMKVTETKKMTIRGEEVEVTIYEGTDENGSVLKQLLVSFPGKGGKAMLAITGDAEYWNQEEIDTFLASIK